jgi:hypothetical protein
MVHDSTLTRLNRTRLALPIAAAAMLAGCALIPKSDRGPVAPQQPEFVGRSMTVVAANGQASTMRFARDGGVVARFGDRETQGRWALDGRRLCFTWGGSFRECWPYAQPFERGRTRSLTSDRGNAVRVTLR